MLFFSGRTRERIPVTHSPSHQEAHKREAACFRSCLRIFNIRYHEHRQSMLSCSTYSFELPSKAQQHC